MTIPAGRAIALPELAVSSGATTPNPGGPCWVWSTTGGAPAYWNGTQWTVVSVGGGGLPAGVTSPGTGRLALAQGTITTALSPLEITETRNAPGVTFPGITYNVTNTASASASKLLSLRTGGIDRISIGNNGDIYVPGTTGTQIPLVFGWNGSGVASVQSFTLRTGAAGVWSIGCESSGRVEFGGAYVFIDAIQGNSSLKVSTGGFEWVSGYTGPVRTYCEGQNVWSQRNGTSAQTHRLYETTDAGGSSNNPTNFSRVALKATAGSDFQLTTEAGGTGTRRNLTLAAPQVSIDGLFFPKQYTTATRPSWTNGAVIFDTDIDKLVIGGASVWEAVTSV